MAYNTKQIIHGAADIFYSALSSRDTGWDAVELPEYVSGTSFLNTLNGDTANWHHVGLTTEGVEVENAPEFKDVEVDQLLDAALVYKTKQTMTVKTTLAEATLEHLLFVWGLGNEQLKRSGSTAVTGAPTDSWWAQSGTDLGLGTDDEELGIFEGALGEAPVERQLAFVGPGPRTATNQATERIYHMRRVLQTETSGHSLKRAEETLFPVTFRCLPDPRASFAGAGYGVVRQRRVTA